MVIAGAEVRLPHVLLSHVPFASDMAELHTRAVPLLRQEPTPRGIARAEPQQAPEFRGKFEPATCVIHAVRHA